MNPNTGRIAFNIAFFFAITSGILLLIIERGSPSYIVDTIAFLVSLIFILLIIIEVRREARG